jgi:hypothetical protein
VSEIRGKYGIVSDIEPDVILKTESWFNNAITDTFLSIPGYEVQPDLQIDRADTDTRGGGLLVYVKEELKVL